MKIFWKKIALYIQFLKDKESALYFVEVSILYKLYVDPLTYVQRWKLKWTCEFWQMNCWRDSYLRSAEEKQSEHNIEYKDSILLLLISWTLKFGVEFGVPGVFHIDTELL